MPLALYFTGDPEADRLLAEEPFALVLGMLLDQQVPMEWAFHSPYDLKQRLGGTLDAGHIAGMDPDDLVLAFTKPTSLHRFPKAMATRTQDLARQLVDDYGGDAARVWSGAETGQQVLANLKGLPGFGEQKARIFVALLAKRLGVQPAGWQEAAGKYGQDGYFSVADIDGPEALAKVREYKKAAKAEAKARPKA